jgi:hypothetical protein
LQRCVPSLLLISLAAPLYSQQAAAGRDLSPHITRFVTVDKTVRLEVLDWGGSGLSVVLLAGGGYTAHVFDDFAPRLTDKYHVYGITRLASARPVFLLRSTPPIASATTCLPFSIRSN